MTSPYPIYRKKVAPPGGSPDKAKALIETEDWSDCADHFRMAVAVLSDRFDDAAEIMESLGKEAKGITRAGYETWPLFQDFRKSDQFRNVFKAIFGEDLTVEIEPQPEKQSNNHATASETQEKPNTETPLLTTENHSNSADPNIIEAATMESVDVAKKMRAPPKQKMKRDTGSKAKKRHESENPRKESKKPISVPKSVRKKGSREKS